MAVTEHRWWERGIIYQIYPRSFQDGDGDGVGDLPGIEQRLEYLAWLGVDAVWISPFYPSPMADFGYDVADYTGVDPLFGTMQDFEDLLKEAHRLGIRVIIDLVPNHTSEEHPWFQESRSSRDNAKRDWYIWRDAAQDGGEPNNWLSVFGGSAWEWHEATQQYYYHAFLKEQPDLNWRNPEVQRAILEVMEFWLDKGVDGFRIDVLWHLIKDEDFRDNPPNPDWKPEEGPYKKLLATYSTDQPEVHEIVRKMRALLNRYEERLMIGEIYLPISELVTYYGLEASGVHLPFNFQLIILPWEAQAVFGAINEYEGSLPDWAWPNWVLGNHDKHRIASRVGDPQARVAAVLLLTLRGTPTMYYGDELGMRNVAIPPEAVHDPWERNVPGIGLGRDPERTPMQWDQSEQAGFTSGKPWLPLSPEWPTENVEVERDDPESMLSFYRRLIELRRSEPALAVGAYAPVGVSGEILAFTREAEGTRYMVAANLGHAPGLLELQDSTMTGTVVLATDETLEGSRVAKRLEMRGDRAIVVRLD